MYWGRNYIKLSSRIFLLLGSILRTVHWGLRCGSYSNIFHSMPFIAVFYSPFPGSFAFSSGILKQTVTMPWLQLGICRFKHSILNKKFQSLSITMCVCVCVFFFYSLTLFSFVFFFLAIRQRFYYKLSLGLMRTRTRMRTLTIFLLILAWNKSQNNKKLFF